MSEISRVQALRQAVASSQTALQATEAGFEVGTRTTVDVLDSRRNLFDAQTNYARSRYDYIINLLRLKLATGTLQKRICRNVTLVDEVATSADSALAADRTSQLDTSAVFSVREPKLRES